MRTFEVPGSQALCGTRTSTWRRTRSVETEGVLEVWKTPAMIANASREVSLGRLGRPEEIAWAVIFVASDQAQFMTGETMYVSGGPRVANRED